MAIQATQREAARRGTLEVLPNHTRGQPERDLHVTGLTEEGETGDSAIESHGEDDCQWGLCPEDGDSSPRRCAENSECAGCFCHEKRRVWIECWCVHGVRCQVTRAGWIGKKTS